MLQVVSFWFCANWAVFLSNTFCM